MNELKSMRDACGEILSELMNENNKVVILNADVDSSTHVLPLKTHFPDRFIECGISEQNMVATAAGMAKEGFIPVVSNFAAFGIFRPFEQIRNTLCIQPLNVNLIYTYAGLSGCEDGVTHQTVEDVSVTTALTNMKVIAPCDFYETKAVIRATIEEPGPSYIRLVKPSLPVITESSSSFIHGKGTVLKSGTDLSLITYGDMCHIANDIHEYFKQNYDYSIECINMTSLKPVDDRLVIDTALKTKAVVTVENHSITGGLGSIVNTILLKQSITDLQIDNIGIEEQCGKTGSYSDLLEHYHLDTKSLIERIRSRFLT
jgi:transketolase